MRRSYATNKGTRGSFASSVRNISRTPSAYLHDLWYDTCVYDVSILEALASRYGAGRLVFGSDYPLGDEDHMAFVRGAENLPGNDLEAVAGRNAAALLGGLEAAT